MSYTQPDTFPEAAEIFWTAKQYDSALQNFRMRRLSNYSPEQLLLAAKGAFRKEDYVFARQILERIPLNQLTTKVLFERQCFLFRSIYMQKSQKPPSEALVYSLSKVITDFDDMSRKAYGPSLQAHHYAKMQEYSNFLVFLQEYGKSTISYNDKMNAEMIEADRSAHKRTGFPCFLISKVWMDEYNRMRRFQANKTYLQPLNNFSMINDIFEAHCFSDSKQTYKNVWLLPGTDPVIVSKKFYNFLCSVYSRGEQVTPIKRLYQEGERYTDQTAPGTVSLVPAAVKCNKSLIYYQLTANEFPQKEILKLVETKFGIGELLNPKDDEDSFQLFYSKDNLTQEKMQRWKTILQFREIKAEMLKEGQFFRHLNPLPLQESELSGKRGLRGLVNLGNSCYMNSCLQCLSNTEEVVKTLTTTNLTKLLPANNSRIQSKLKRMEQNEKSKNEEQGGDGSILVALGALLKQIWREGEGAVSPFKFKMYFAKRNPLFQGKTQEDAHEFLVHLLDGVHSDLKGPNGLMRWQSKLDVTTNVQKVRDYFQRHQLDGQESLVYDLFRGSLHTTIKCLKCKTSSHSFDLFLSLPLPVPVVELPILKIHFRSPQTYHTRTFQVGIHNIKTLNELFKVFQAELQKKDDKKAVNKEIGSPKEDRWKRNQNSGAKDSVMKEDKGKSGKRKYILLGFNKEEDPVQFWNMGFDNSLTSNDLTLEEVQKKKMQLVFFELEEPKEEGMTLVLVQYKVEATIGSDETIGLPRFGYVSEELLKTQKGVVFRKWVVENDPQNHISQADMENIKVYNWQQKGSFLYSITAFFRRKERLFLDSTFIDKEINCFTPTFPIRECFTQMGLPETLSDGWKCGGCQSTDGAEKCQSLVNTNTILVLALKRFQANGSKIKHLVEYPLQRLDVGEWLQEKNGFGKQLYDLYGVCLHEGNMEYGHYRAYCKHWVSGQWWEFDDERVKKVDPKDVVSPHAYMLFYKRREL